MHGRSNRDGVAAPQVNIRRRTRRVRRLVTVVTMLLAVAAVAVVVVGQVRPRWSEAQAPAVTTPTEHTTARVDVGDLVEQQQFAGDLDYGTKRDMPAGVDGVITWVPASNTVINSGDMIWQIDNRPTVYLVAPLPMYRTLSSGVERGPDVAQLEFLLHSMGFGPTDWEPDDRFNKTTRSAIKAFQEAHGLKVDGELTASDVIIGQAPIRVDSAQAVGDRVEASSKVLSVTSADPVATAKVSSRQFAWLSDGGDVSVVMADGTRAPAALENFTLVKSDSGDSEYQLTFRVEGLTLTQPQPADFVVDKTIAADSMLVPVDALVALVEGGYAVELQDNAGSTLVPVDVVGYGDTTVAITGTVSPGDEVVVP